MYIEEYLEAELHLHDLPVFGDFRTDVKTDQSKFELAAPQNPGEPMECFSCGATLLKSELIVKQGYVVCDYCQSLTLLYKPDMPYPVLGLPDVHAVHLQIKLKQEGANFVLTEDDNDRPVQWVQIESEFLVVQKVDQDFQAIHTTDVTKIFVKAFDTKEAVERENLEQISLPEMSDLLEGYAEAVSKEEAYSGDIDAEKMVRNVRFGVQYRVVAQMSDGNLICLLDNLADVREAVLWSEFMCEKCGVSSEDTHLIF